MPFFVLGCFTFASAGSQVTVSYAGGNYTWYANLSARLNQRLATRTGPGTQYDEPGSFFSAGTYVTILSKAWDSRNGIWWVQVAFRDGNNNMYTAYTGVKRFDNLNLNSIPEEYAIGTCSVSGSTECYYGPSYQYKRISRNVPAGAQCTIYGYVYSDEADFILVEFYDSGAGTWRRAWIADWNTEAGTYEMWYGF